MLLMILNYIFMFLNELFAHESKKKMIEMIIKLIKFKLSSSRLKNIKHVKELKLKKYYVMTKIQLIMNNILADQIELEKII